MSADYPTIELCPIPGFPGYLACRLGVIFSAKGGIPSPLCPGTQRHGYKHVILYSENGKRITKKVHHAILETFVGPCPAGMESLHANDIHDDNRLSNLRWGTRAENMIDKVRNGRIAKGTDRPNAKLTEDDVRIIRTMRQCDAVRMFGICQRNAKRIINRHTWKHVV